MTDDNRDLLRATFTSHENLAPDAEAVYARVNEIAKGHRWRRRGLQAAGGVALGAGLIAGVVAVPNFVPSQQQGGTFQAAAPASPEASPEAPAPVTPGPVPVDAAEQQRGWDAYFGAGYGYNDAEALAKLWNSEEQIGTVKAQAGLMLIAGQTLPVEPTGNETEGEEEPDPGAAIALNAFFNAGYTWDEAERFAELWNLADPSEAKVAAGQKLIDGETLPIKPKPANVEAAKDNQRIEKFFAAGYDYDDAVELAQIWKLDDAGQAKVEAGKRLLAGKKLPIQP